MGVIIAHFHWSGITDCMLSDREKRWERGSEIKGDRNLDNHGGKLRYSDTAVLQGPKLGLDINSFTIISNALV